MDRRIYKRRPPADDYSLNDYFERYPEDESYYVGTPTMHNSFREPEPAYNNRIASEKYDDYDDYYQDEDYEMPSVIFNTNNVEMQERFSPLPMKAELYDPGRYHDEYEGDYEMGGLQNPGYHGMGRAYDTFEDKVYDDEEEMGFDKQIQYNQYEGDTFDLNPVQMIPQEVETDPQLVDLPQSPFGDENAEFPDPPEKEPVRSKQVGIATGLNGHLVLDCPVATELLRKFPGYNPSADDYGLSREFSYMRYTAVTCGPSNFYRDGYILRPVHYPMPRQTELMIVVTMYNEDDLALARTLKGIFKNIKHLESRNRSPIWGQNSWKKVVVCIVSDGRMKINERAKALLAALGVYQEGLAKSRVDNKQVQGHIYEYTTRVGISSITDTVKLTTDKVVPVQLLFCLKEKNTKKINSHRWCLQALGQVLDPKVVILLDCGTRPSGKSLYRLWKEFDRNPQVAGACGEIKASMKKRQFFTNPIVYAQNFEYKTSNILDKPTESIFGFITVLPGAFSAYRYVALQNDISGKGPMEKYFKGEFLHGSGELDPNDDEYELKSSQMKHEAGIFTSNMYLAEDRILCYEILAKKGCSWLLRYCKSASAETDVPERLSEFILQRRRWLNGSFFAAIYSLAHFPKIWVSSHSIGRKIWLHILFFYQTIALIVSWFSIGSYFLVFRILTTSLGEKSLHFAPGKILSAVLLWLYLASLVTTFVLSFGNKPRGTEKFYIVIVAFFAILMAYMIFASVFMSVKAVESLYHSHTEINVDLFFKNSTFRDLIIANASTVALYFVSSLIYLEPWHMFTSFLQYLLLSPSYINVLNIYAFCNIDDISWGTKGEVGGEDLGVAKVREDGTFDVNIPTEAEEINKSYLQQLDKIKVPQKDGDDKPKGTNEDYYAFVRSITVLVWIFSNFVIIAVVLETAGFSDIEQKKLKNQKRASGSDSSSSGSSSSSDDLNSKDSEKRSQIFLTVILWTVAFMALFRFIGCSAYLVLRFFRRFTSK